MTFVNKPSQNNSKTRNWSFQILNFIYLLGLIWLIKFSVNIFRVQGEYKIHLNGCCLLAEEYLKGQIVCMLSDFQKVRQGVVNFISKSYLQTNIQLHHGL